MRTAFLAVVVLAAASWADSPLTSTDFATAYQDLPGVREAKGMEALEGAPLKVLLSRSSSDHKLAVANALGWGKAFAPQFLAKLEQARSFDAEKVGLQQVAPSDLFVLGYLLAMDDYLELKPLKPKGKGLWGKTPQALLEAAAQALPDDFTVQYVSALVRAQPLLQGDWCQVFRIPAQVVRRFPEAKRNLRPGALEAAQGYLSTYEESCAGSKAAAQKGKEELNQIYTVSRAGPYVITGTQGGVVVWSPQSPRPVAVRPGVICTGAVVGERYWAGCRDEVLRWDGAQFKAYKVEKPRDTEYFAPMKGPGGALWVRHGARTFAYDAAKDAFAPVQAPWPEAVYAAHVRANGEVWWVDFLRAVMRDGQALPLKSLEYPGTDPRRFAEGADGSFWVEDFEGGLYRLGADGRFAHVEGLADKGSGVAWDAQRQRRYLLHYTRGLEVLREGKPTLHVGTETLQYVRAMMLDANGDVWLGGWTELLRLSPDGEKFGRTSYRVR